jgi:hypothetical protein
MSTVADAALPIARSLAAGHPQAMLPCPLCAGDVRGENLEKHLGKAHPGAASVECLPPLVWSGPSTRVPMVAFLAMGVGAGVCVLGAVLHIVGGGATLLGGAIAAVALLAAGVAASGGFRARLTYDGAGLSLRHVLGLGVRRVALPAALETGSVWERSGDAETPSVLSPGDPRRVGGYLRLHDASGSITVQSRKTSLAACWEAPGLRHGPRRRSSDIRLDAVDFVGLVYLLAERGMLSPRTG